MKMRAKFLSILIAAILVKISIAGRYSKNKELIEKTVDANSLLTDDMKY